MFIPPQIFSCEIGTRKFWWISTAFYQWFVKKLKNETVATFYDVCGVFGSENDSFSTFPSRMKVINLFKAKKVTFRERKSSKVENGPFWLHLTPNFLERDENRFFAFANLNLVPNPSLKGHFARRRSSNTNRDFACSLLVKNLMEFWWFWSPFGHFSSVPHVRTYRGQTGPAGPGPHAGNSHPACGLRPPAPIIKDLRYTCSAPLRLIQPYLAWFSLV